MHTANFRDSEFVCHCGKCGHSRVHQGLVAELLMTSLQQARDSYGGPIIVVSGRRCLKHNADVRGVYNSYHLKGLAADVRADDMNKLFACLCDVHDFRYIEPHDTYIHVDIGHVRNNRINDKRTVINHA